MVFSFLLLENRGFGPLVLIPLLGTSIFVLFSVSGSTRNLLTRLLNTKVLQFFGDIAFPLYLIHWPAMVLLRNSPDQSSLVNITIYLGAITFFSYLLHKYIEIPTLAIDISRFRISQNDGMAKFQPRFAYRSKRVALIAIFSLIVPLAFLSYPKESEKNFSNLISILTNQRYGTVLERNLPTEEQSNFETEQMSPGVKTSGTSETSTPTKDTQLTENPTVVILPSPTPSIRDTVISVNSQWLASLKIAARTTQAKGDYASGQIVAMEELRKSWFSGCLDSKSALSACVVGSGKREIVLLGDSFSFALKEALVKSIPSGWQIRILTKGSCLPWDVTQYNKNGTIRTDCSDHAAWVEQYLSETRPAMIIATGADQWLSNNTYDEWGTGFRSTIRQYLAFSERVVIVSSAPGSGNLKDCVGTDLSMRKCFGTPNEISKFVDIQKRESQSLKFRYVNLIDYLCIESICPAVIEEAPVYADGNHMSAEFAKKFSTVIKSLRLFD